MGDSQVARLRALDSSAPTVKEEADVIDDHFTALQSSAMRTCRELRAIIGDESLQQLILAIQAVVRFKSTLKKHVIDPRPRRVKRSKGDPSAQLRAQREKEERQR